MEGKGAMESSICHLRCFLLIISMANALYVCFLCMFWFDRFILLSSRGYAIDYFAGVMVERVGLSPADVRIHRHIS